MTFDIKNIVRESLREAFYTKKSSTLSKESLDILTEAYGEYIKGISEEIDSWLSE